MRKKIWISIVVCAICLIGLFINREFSAVMITLFSLFGFGLFGYGFAKIDKDLTKQVGKAFIGLILLGLAFGGAYSILGQQYFPKANTMFDYYYYSFMTMTTFDYPDIENSTTNIIIRTIVIIQCLIALFYGVIVLGTLFNKINDGNK